MGSCDQLLSVLVIGHNPGAVNQVEKLTKFLKPS